MKSILAVIHVHKNIPGVPGMFKHLLLVVYDQQMHTCWLSDHQRIMINFMYVTNIVYVN